MITTEGALYIKRFMAGQGGKLSSSMAFGAGKTAPVAGDIRLDFETSRADISLIAFDAAADEIVFKAPVPDSFDGVITEVGLYAQSMGFEGSKSPTLIVDFEEGVEDWLTGGLESTFVETVNSRVGASSLQHNPAASASITSSLSELAIDLGEYAAGDKFNFAFYNANTNVNTLVFKFYSDSSNYYTITITNPAAGYITTSVLKGAAVPTGSPSWSSITSVDVITTAKSSGAADVLLDGIRIEDETSLDPESVLIARQVLSTNFIKRVGTQMEAEFRLDINI